VTPKLKPPGTKRLKVKCDIELLLSTSAFIFNSRRYNVVLPTDGTAELVAWKVGSRGLHSSTFQLNINAFCGIGGALRVCLGVILRVFRRCWGVLGGVGGLKGVFRVRYGSG